jgi:ribosomal protein S27AE
MKTDYVHFNASGFTRCPRCHADHRKQRIEWRVSCAVCGFDEPISANNASAGVLAKLAQLDEERAA